MSDVPFRQLTADFSVAPQLETEDFARAAAQGFRTVINNRPDGEVAGQLTSAQAREAATASGMAYVHVPVISGGLRPEDVEAMREAIDAHHGPFLAYCRSGTRSCTLWALASAQQLDPEKIVEAAAGAGYDLAPLAAKLAATHEERR